MALLAPAASGSALEGPGPAEAEHLIPWDGPDLAALLTEEGLPKGPLRDAIAAFDTAVAYTRSAALLRGLSGAVKNVVGHDPLPPPGSGHASEWLMQPLRASDLDAPAVVPVPVCAPTAVEARAAEALTARLPERFLAIHPGSGSPGKNWPAHRFHDLLEARSPGRAWLLVEGPADAEPARTLERRPGAVVAKGLPPRVLGAVLARAGAYVGNDSGVSHLAAAWGATTVALFGATDPAVWAPLGPDVRVVRSATGRMEDIRVDAVIEMLIASRTASRLVSGPARDDAAT